MNHQDFLLEALKLAKERKGFCYPNPSVGAVLVQDNKIIACGNHQGPGQPHAEVMACSQINTSLEQAVLYVTLEPCCHWGRTPPCTDLILQRGIKQVYYGFHDPNPKVSGSGQRVLQENGVLCEQIDCPEINEFYQSYCHWTHTKKPWVVSKLAISLDAKIADSLSRPVAITSKEAQVYTHERRLWSDAILTSVKTVIQDNPALNVRLNDQIIAKRLYILDSRLELPLTAQVFSTTLKITVFHSSDDRHKIQELQNKGVDCQKVACEAGYLDLNEILHYIGADGVQELWVEAGGKIFGSFAKNKLAQKSFVYIAPKLLGETALDAFKKEDDVLSNAKDIKCFNLGPDSICEITW